MFAPETSTPVHVRLATPADAPAIQGIYAPIVRHTAISFEWAPPDVRTIETRIHATLRQLPWLVATSGRARPSDILGYAYAAGHRHRDAYQWAVEVSVYVSEAARRSGIAHRLYAVLFSLLHAQHYRIAYAIIALPNEASVRLHEALDFAPIGVFPAAGFKSGAWHDVLWMRRELGPNVEDPESPVPLSALASSSIELLLDT